MELIKNRPVLCLEDKSLVCMQAYGVVNAFVDQVSFCDKNGTVLNTDGILDLEGIIKEWKQEYKSPFSKEYISNPNQNPNCSIAGQAMIEALKWAIEDFEDGIVIPLD